ncbi:MAG: hypothetical protein V4713_03905 [Pseudomonadota bacterium]
MQTTDVGQSAPERAEIGDTISCDVRMSRPETIAMRLDTPASVDHANKLLAGGWGWRLLRHGEYQDMSPNKEGGAYYMPPNT